MSKNSYITVLDLPQLYTHPSAEELISTLNQLALAPPSWDPQTRNTESQDESAFRINEAGIPKYLTSIVASPLSWIDEDRREPIWEMASKRLSERSGRTAIPSVSRTFLIPTPASKTPISISLYEPSLTSDNLGHKTWLASYLLAKRLPYLLPHLLPPSTHPPPSSPSSSPSPSSTPTPTPPPKVQILELGSGTGLLGLAASSLFPTTTNLTLTDLPAITPNLQRNVSSHVHVHVHLPSQNNIKVHPLDWSQPSPATLYDIILAADPLYSPLHPPWLINTISLFLKREPHARVIIELPLREVYRGEVEGFKKGMEGRGFGVVEEGEEGGREDWGRDGERDDGLEDWGRQDWEWSRNGNRDRRQDWGQNGEAEKEKGEVGCWWGVWKWEESFLNQVSCSQGEITCQT